MDRKSKFLFLFVALLIPVSVASLFYKSIVLQDFDILVFEGSEDSMDEPVEEVAETDTDDLVDNIASSSSEWEENSEEGAEAVPNSIFIGGDSEVEVE